MLNAEGADANPGQKEPWILRQLDMLHFRGIEVLAYPVKSKFQSAGNCFLRCIPYTASRRTLGNLQATPPALDDLLFQPPCIDSR